LRVRKKIYYIYTVQKMIAPKEKIPDAIIEHNIQIDEKKYNDSWHACCCKIDRRCLQFGVQLGIIFIVIIFCVFKLSQDLSCEEQSTYLGLLTMVLGVCLPQPKLKE
jgi:hypothetical protein